MVNATYPIAPMPPLLAAFQAVVAQANAVAAQAPVAPAPDQLVLRTPTQATYTVQSGDSLVMIAQRQLGSKLRWQEIWALNREQVPNPNVIVAGTVLRMPGDASPHSPVAPQPPAAPLAPGQNPPRAVLEAMLNEAADRHGIPRAILKAVAERESNWRQFNDDGTTVSHGNPGSTDWGLMQINDYAHPQAFPRVKTDLAYNLEYGAKYLAAQFRRYGNWTDAVAAYNAGSARRNEDGSYRNQGYVSYVLDAARRHGHAGDGSTYYA